MSFDVMSQVKAAFTSLVSHSDDQDTVAKTGTGTLGGATVQMASTATPPARADGIGERLKAAFAPLADAFRDAKAWLQAKMHPPIDVQAPVHDKARSIARIGGASSTRPSTIRRASTPWTCRRRGSGERSRTPTGRP